MKKTLLTVIMVSGALLTTAGGTAAQDPSGELTATPNPCSPDPQTGACFPTLTWRSDNIPTVNLPKVQLRYMGASGPKIVRTRDANVIGETWTVGPGLKVTTQQPRTFRLYATYDNTLNSSSEIFLDEITLRTDEPQARLWSTPNPCPVDCTYDELGDRRQWCRCRTV